MFSTGIDVSNHQGVINWDYLNLQSIDFVYMLVSDGGWRGRPPGVQLSIAEAYAMNTKYCQKPCGAYLFARPHNTDPYQSAEDMMNITGRMAMPPMLDVESYDDGGMSLGLVVDWCRIWLDHMRRLDGRTPLLYNSAFYKGPGLARYFPDNPWWLPSYMANSTINPDPLNMRSPPLNGNRPPDIWQYTDHGRLAGIPGNVDMNLILTDKLIPLIEVNDVDLEGLARLFQNATTSAIYHVNVHDQNNDGSNQPSMKFAELAAMGAIAPITSDTPADIAFQCFPDFTMVQRDPTEVNELKFLGIPDHGFRNDQWFGKLAIKSRDVA
jgi:GH25 family lysozyme M1 (1,4-beta-N-acetylmuramidase)